MVTYRIESVMIPKKVFIVWKDYAFQKDSGVSFIKVEDRK